MAANFPIRNVPLNATLQQLVDRVLIPVADRAMYIAGGQLCIEIQKTIGVQGPPRSKPYNPPHIDTAKLILSIAFQYVPAQFRTVAVADRPYARKLEFGGIAPRFGGGYRYQEPRPFMRRALVQFATQRNLRRCFRQAMDPNHVYSTHFVRNDIV